MNVGIPHEYILYVNIVNVGIPHEYILYINIVNVGIPHEYILYVNIVNVGIPHEYILYYKHCECASVVIIYRLFLWKNMKIFENYSLLIANKNFTRD